MCGKNLLRSVLFILILKSALGRQGRIYGGKQIDIKDVPYMAELFVSDDPIEPGKPLNGEGCGASIIRTNLLISAGHCELSHKIEIHFFWIYSFSHSKRRQDK